MGALAVGGVLAGCGSSSSAPAAAVGGKEVATGSGKTRKATLTYGVPTLDTTTVWFGAIPIALGYYAEEGLDVTVEPVSGGAESIGAIVSGRAQFATQSTEVIYTSVDQGTDLTGFYCEIPKDFIGIAVPADGDITSISQLRGKTIGTLAIGADPELEVEAVLAHLGLTSGDYSMLAVGSGEPALHALTSGSVQALGLWAMIYAGFEQSGGPKLRIFQPEPIPSLSFEHATVVMNQTIEQDPDLVASFSRAIAKSLVFLSAADPAEMARLQYKVYPSTKPPSMSTETAVDYGAAILRSLLPYMDLDARVNRKAPLLGSASTSGILGYRDLLYNAKVIKQQKPASAYFTSRFLAHAANFDFEPVIERAKGFKA